MRARRPAESYVKNLKRVSDALGDSLLTPFLSNHDTGRTVGLVQGRQAPDRVKFAHALIALMGGYTFTYYGEEIGMAGAGADPNKRLGMLWDEDEVTDPPPGATSLEYPYPGVKAQLEDPLSILNYIKKLNHQKISMPAIALGTLAFGPTDTDSCVVIRQYQGENLYIAVNFSAKEKWFSGCKIIQTISQATFECPALTASEPHLMNPRRLFSIHSIAHGERHSAMDM